MKEYLRLAVGIFGVLFLCLGAVIIISNFSPNVGILLRPEFMTDEKYSLGCLGMGLLLIGAIFFSWYRKDIISWRPKNKKKSADKQ